MTPKGLILILGASLLALPDTSWGQRLLPWPVNSRVYRTADGLPEPAGISVTLAPQGNVFARHMKAAAISQLDGYSVGAIPAPDTGKGRVYESPAGQLWTVVVEGLQEFRNGHWVLHPVPEIAAEFRTRLPRLIDPIPLCPVRQDVVLYLLPDRLLQFSAEDQNHPHSEVMLTAAQTRLEKFSGMTLGRDGGLWIAGTRGLAKVSGPLRKLKRDGEWHDYLPPEPLQLHNFQELHLDDEGTITALAESGTNQLKMLALFDGEHWSAEVVPIEKTRFAWRGPDKTDWAATISSFFEWEPGERDVVESEESPGRQFYDLAVEPGGAFWLATSDGLARYAPLTWRSPAPARKINSLVRCLTGDAAGRLWFVAGSSLHCLHNERHREFPLPSAAPSSLPGMRALFPLKDGSLLFNADDQCFQLNPETGAFTPLLARHPAGPIKPLGLLRDGRFCVQSSGSPPPPSLAPPAPPLLGATAVEPGFRLEAYDGANFEPLGVPAPKRSPGSNFSSLFAAQNGDLWFSSDHGVAWYHDQKWRTFASTDGNAPDSVIDFAESTDGSIWAATQERVWGFDGRSWTMVRTGLDRINALIAARDGSLWLGADSGLYRFFQGSWVENGAEEGLPSGGVRELCEDSRGRIWAGTAHGLRLYHPEADPDPPKTYIQLLGEKERSVPEGGTVALSFSGQDRWNYTSRQRLLYSYRLSGRDWSPFQEERSVSFIDLPAGKQALQVRAMDRNCNIDPNPARFEFVVVLPWYKESRLVLILIAGVGAVLFFAGLAFNRHRQLLRSYAEVERKIAQRTQELEVANRQLLHSQKMNALGALAAGIAHDFNNILSIIKGSAQIIEDNLDNPGKVRTRVDRINTVVEQGAGIVKGMLGFSRESPEPAAPCDLNAVLNDTVKLLGDRFLHEVQVTLERAPALPEVTCSRDFIQQVLLNLILNAAESMDKRKQVVLSTRLLEKPPVSPVLAPAPAVRYVAVSVRDFGCGISPDNLPRIFEPFFTTKAFSARRGTGLGLSMVYELAKKMEAGIAVETIVDQGSTFTLILPVPGKAKG
ncbi:MAG: ATP-binding protein [Verrucomicrobiota bacterium]